MTLTKALTHTVDSEFNDLSIKLHPTAGADPGFFLGGGAPLRNDITDGEVKKKKNQIRIHEEESFISGGGCAPPAPSP